MNANEIVQALRDDCGNCSEVGPLDNECYSPYYCPNRDAADLIESLTAENTEIRGINSKYLIRFCGLDEQLAELQAKYDKLNDFEQSQSAKLLAQLSESQRRERAAVEELRGICWACAKSEPYALGSRTVRTCDHMRECGILAQGGRGGKNCSHWQWRGPQEEGEESR